MFFCIALLPRRQQHSWSEAFSERKCFDTSAYDRAASYSLSLDWKRIPSHTKVFKSSHGGYELLNSGQIRILREERSLRSLIVFLYSPILAPITSFDSPLCIINESFTGLLQAWNLPVSPVSQILPPQLNRIVWNLEQSEPNVTEWPRQILGAIRTLATVWQGAEFCLFLWGK